MSEANMTGYQTARAISRHLGIAISNEDAVRLHDHIQSIAANAYTNGILNEREACAKICEDAWMAFTQPSNGRPSLNPFPELRFAAEKIRARGNQ
jgi:hypothetical protein